MSVRRPLAPPREAELLANLVGSTSRRRRGGPAFGASLSVHVALVVGAILGSVFWPTPLPEQPLDYIRVLMYDPPPPPPLPLPKGNPLLPERAGSRPRPMPQPERPIPQPEQPPPEASSPSDSTVPRLALPPAFVPPDLGDEQWGSATGSEFGVPEGMEEGVLGGQVGGVPGGVIGGVLGGRLGGIVPVADGDRPPRLIRQTRPQYPHRAFVKKVEGTVLLEILINVDGRVAHARVLKSVPLLDEAALATVRQWLFEPALKSGRPVATLGRAPIRFTIY